MVKVDTSVLINQPIEKVFDFETRQQGHGAGRTNRPIHDRGHSEDVEYGNHTEKTLLSSFQLWEPGHNLIHIGSDIAVREHHPFGHSGGAAGVLQ